MRGLGLGMRLHEHTTAKLTRVNNGHFVFIQRYVESILKFEFHIKWFIPLIRIIFQNCNIHTVSLVTLRKGAFFVDANKVTASCEKKTRNSSQNKIKRVEIISDTRCKVQWLIATLLEWLMQVCGLCFLLRLQCKTTALVQEITLPI